jgi:hypothetical protein
VDRAFAREAVKEDKLFQTTKNQSTFSAVNMAQHTHIDIQHFPYHTLSSHRKPRIGFIYTKYRV